MKRSSGYRYHRKSRFHFIKTLFKTSLILGLLTATIILLTPTPFYKDGFKNLKELQVYANKTNEQTPMENADTLRPEFTKYYLSQIPTFTQKIKNKINLLLYLVGFGEKPVWSVSFFKTALENTGKARETAGLKDNLIYKIQTDPTSKFIIFGNMQGAFHSLVRCLTKIKELGFIGDDLKISSPNNYIIFMGDLIDRSPFTLEILTAAIKLIEINPQNVIYLRGNHEAKSYWLEHTLKTELQIRAAYLSKDTVPLEKEVNTFFNTLPLAAYLTVPNTQADFVRISEFGRNENEILNEANYSEFLTQQQASKLNHFVIGEKAVTQQNIGEQPEPRLDTTINIKALFRNEKKRKTFQKMDGLRLLTPEMDSVAWNILSCPTIVYQKALEFYNDAFVVLSAADKIEDWEVTLYSHDVRTSAVDSKYPFKETKFNFISGLDVESHKKLAPKTPVIAPAPVQPQAATTTFTQPNTQAPSPQQTQASQMQAPQAQVQPTIIQQPVVQPTQVTVPVQQQVQTTPTQTVSQTQQPAQPTPLTVPVQTQVSRTQVSQPQGSQPVATQTQAIEPVQQPIVVERPINPPQTNPPTQ